jgi:hypothetical protein
MLFGDYMRHTIYRGEEIPIYESKEELYKHVPDAVLKTHIKEMNVGEYLLTLDGFIVRLDQIQRYDNIKRGKPLLRYRFGRTVRLMRENSKSNWNLILIHPKYDSRLSVSHRTLKKMFFINSLRFGATIEAAYRLAYPNNKMNNIRSGLTRLLKDPIVYNELYRNNEEMKMSVKEQLAKHGINQESIAVHIANIINDPNANATLKRWALETSLEMVNTAETRRISALEEASNAMSNQVRDAV